MCVLATRNVIGNVTETTAEPARAVSTHRLAWEATSIAAGTSTLLATSGMLAAVGVRFHVAPHLYFSGFVPAGAIVCGALSTSGHYAAARLGGRRPGPIAIGLILLAALGATTLIDALQRQMGYVPAPPGATLRVVTSIGFIVGAALVTRQFVAPLYCFRCKRYMPAPVAASCYLRPGDIGARFEDAYALVRAGRGAEAMARIAALDQSESNHKLSLEHAECVPCGREHYRLQVRTFEASRQHVPLGLPQRDAWIPVPGFDATGQVERLLDPRRSGRVVR